MSDPVRDAASAAYDAVEGTAESAPESEAAPTPVESAPEPGPDVAQPAIQTEGADHETPAEAAQRARDESGRFTKAPKLGKASTTPAPVVPKSVQSTTKPATTTERPLAAPDVVPAAPEKAPGSWSPAAREHWAALPPEVRAEVHRREKETSVQLQETSQARQFTDAFTRATAPYERYIRAEGVDPLTAVSNTFQAIAVLHEGTPMHMAQIAASIIRTYGVDPDLLQAAYNGTPAPEGQAQQAMVDPRTIAAQVEQRVMQQMDQRRTYAIQERAVGEVETFGADKEFFSDVRPLMAVILDSATAAKRAMSLDDAYKMALGFHPEVANVMQQREAAKAAKNANASTERARAASSSIRSQPAGAPRTQNGRMGIESAVAAAYDEVMSR